MLRSPFTKSLDLKVNEIFVNQIAVFRSISLVDLSNLQAKTRHYLLEDRQDSH